MRELELAKLKRREITDLTAKMTLLWSSLFYELQPLLGRVTELIIYSDIYEANEIYYSILRSY